MSGWVHDAALGFGAAITGIVLSSFAGILIGKWIAVLNPQHHRSLSQEQASRDGQSDRLGGFADGGQVNDIHTDFSPTFRERNHG